MKKILAFLTTFVLTIAVSGQTLNVTPSRENAELVFSATGAETVISQFRSLVGGLLIVR